MWVCNRCECTFPEPDLTREHGEKYNTCPICLSKDVKETRVCYSCGNATDNYGICDECRDIITKDFKAWFEEEMKFQHVKADDLIKCIDRYLEDRA